MHCYTSLLVFAALGLLSMGHMRHSDQGGSSFLIKLSPVSSSRIAGIAPKSEIPLTLKEEPVIRQQTDYKSVEQRSSNNLPHYGTTKSPFGNVSDLPSTKTHASSTGSRTSVNYNNEPMVSNINNHSLSFLASEEHLRERTTPKTPHAVVTKIRPSFFQRRLRETKFLRHISFSLADSDEVSRDSHNALRRVRRDSNASALEEIFACAASDEKRQRLAALWNKNRASSLVEYMQTTLMDNSHSGRECEREFCQLSEEDSAMWTEGFNAEFASLVSATLQATNLLTSIFMAPLPRTFTDSIFGAVLASLIETDQKAHSASVIFERGTDGEAERMIYKSRSGLAGRPMGRAGGEGSDEDRHLSAFLAKHLSACSQTTSQGDRPAGVITTREETSWRAPSLHCSTDIGRMWIASFEAPFFDCDDQKRLVLKGWLRLDVDLRDVIMEINQCAEDRRPFAKTHKCPLHSVCEEEIVASEGDLRRTSYRCKCKDSFYSTAYNSTANALLDTYVSPDVADVGVSPLDDDGNFQCLPCPMGCPVCLNESPCLLVYDSWMRGIPMGIECLCITVLLLLTFMIVHLRKTKVMKASFWCLLEIIVLGAMLLYLTVVVQYFVPTEFICLLVPWLRELGFTIVYGTLILKVYSVLAGFQSRKAHRVQVRDKDLFKYLCCMLIVVIGYMAAWTAVTLDNSNSTITLLEITSYGAEKYAACRCTWWDYVIEIGELLFVSFGVYLCYCARSAPSAYKELRFITFAICNEALLSTAFYFTRHFLRLTIHPDYMYLLYFARCQLTVSVMILLVLGPKLWFTRRPGGLSGDEEPSRPRGGGTGSSATGSSCPESVKLNSAINPNGDVDMGDISLAEMNPDEIRIELKRVYTQLQIYKTKTMRQDNPHISKRRGGRKQTHRRFSLQAFHSKHKHHSGGGGGGGSGGGGAGCGGSDRGEVSGERGDTEVSRTPEDSTNSAEGVSIYMDEASTVETGARTPTVTFKSDRYKGK